MPIESAPPPEGSPSPSTSPEKPRPIRAAKQPWRPRIDDGREGLNSFAHVDPDGASPLASPQLRDANEDTAPLQGSKDRSDEDSLDIDE
jgi:hypothetical protein